MPALTAEEMATVADVAARFKHDHGRLVEFFVGRALFAHDPITPAIMTTGG
jgi:hypothetical protein